MVPSNIPPGDHIDPLLSNISIKKVKKSCPEVQEIGNTYFSYVDTKRLLLKII